MVYCYYFFVYTNFLEAAVGDVGLGVLLFTVLELIDLIERSKKFPLEMILLFISRSFLLAPSVNKESVLFTLLKLDDDDDDEVVNTVVVTSFVESALLV